MNEPRTTLERQAEATEVDATMMKVERPGVVCSPVLGKGMGGRRGATGVAGSGNRAGKKKAMMDAEEATMKETAVACTWRRARLPVMMERRVDGSCSSPTLAAVPRRAERFISRLPLRLRTAGMTIMS